MKNIILFCCFTFCFQQLPAQQLSAKEYTRHQKKIEQSKNTGSVIVSLDTVYYQGEAAALLIKVASADHDFSVKNLSGNQLIYCRFNSYDNAEHTGNIGSVEKKYYYQFIFPASKKQFETENKSSQQLAEFIISSGLIKNGVIDETVLNNIAAETGNKYSADKNKPVEIFNGNATGKNYTIVKRDTKKLIIVRESIVEQDGRQIGSIENEVIPEGLITYYVYRISLPDGTPVAKAKYQSYGIDDIEINTGKDDKVIRIAKPAYDIDKTILQFLVDNLYL